MKKKNVKKTKDPKTEKKELNPNQELFCQLYFGPGDFFGNGTWCYIKAFNIDVPLIAYSYLKVSEQKIYNSAKTMAYALLTKIDIRVRGKKILRDHFKANPADEELSWAMIQRKDVASKVQAIREFNRLKNRVQDKLDVTSKGKAIPTQIVNVIKYAKPEKID